MGSGWKQWMDIHPVPIRRLGTPGVSETWPFRRGETTARSGKIEKFQGCARGRPLRPPLREGRVGGLELGAAEPLQATSANTRHLSG